jgi:hypothetical protein
MEMTTLRSRMITSLEKVNLKCMTRLHSHSLTNTPSVVGSDGFILRR